MSLTRLLLIRHAEVEARWIKHFNVCSLREANFKIEAKDFEVASTHIPDLESTLTATDAELRRIENTLQPFVDAATTRMAAALQLLNHQALPFDTLQPLKAESAALLQVLSGLADVLRNLHSIRRRFPAFELLLQNRGNHQDPAKVDAVISPIVKIIKAELDTIHARLKDVPYPFPHASGQITVSQYAHGRGNYQHDIEAAYVEGQAAMDHLYALYYKTAGRLASIAESIEERMKEQANPA